MGTRAQQQDTAELKARRQAALEKVPDGIVLLHSFNGLKHWDESGFHQDASFYYFTGLANAHEAILALDGIRKETWLFVAPRKSKFGADLAGIDAVLVDPGKDTEQALGIDHVVLWDEFEAFVERRRKEDPQLAVYLDSAGQTGHMLGDVSNPPGLLPIENPYVLWAAAIRQKWPDAKVKEVFGVLDEVRQVKSEKEIDWMREAARLTAEGFWAGVRATGPDKTQRQVEGAVMDACYQAGSNGASIWPWVRSGLNGIDYRLFEAFADYRNMNRRMQAGEVVRLDVGCDHGMYKGDFGRTVPVSGKFDEGQSETMELLNGAYLAGVGAMRPGASAKDVWSATHTYVEQHKDQLRTPLAKEAAANAVKASAWPLHGLGVDMAEGTPKVFRPGNVVCYEPLFAAGNQAFFVEDTILITQGGHEILNPALPYAPADIEKAMAKKH